MKEINHIPIYIEQARNRLEFIRHRKHESEVSIENMFHILEGLCMAVEEIHARLEKVESEVPE